jgi:uncharacterized membrane protein YdcZ (DUF606 family)
MKKVVSFLKKGDNLSTSIIGFFVAGLILFMYASAAQIFHNAYAFNVAGAPWYFNFLGILATAYNVRVTVKVINGSSKIGKGEALVQVLAIAGLLVFSLLALMGFTTAHGNPYL